jgi:nucleolar protein 4
MDHDSGRSRGTGFVCFWNLTDANACLEEADRMREDLDVQVM